MSIRFLVRKLGKTLQTRETRENVFVKKEHYGQERIYKLTGVERHSAFLNVGNVIEMILKMLESEEKIFKCVDYF